jgi:AcrR family transcriptional regulator
MTEDNAEGAGPIVIDLSAAVADPVLDSSTNGSSPSGASSGGTTLRRRSLTRRGPEGSDVGVRGLHPTDEAPEATRQRLIDVTTELLNEGGNHSLRLADVARATGVAVSTIYAHFKDRTDLVAAARLEQFRSHAQEAMGEVSGAIVNAERLEDVAQAAFWPTLASPDHDDARLRRWDRIEAIADARHIPALCEGLEELQGGLNRQGAELVRRAQDVALVDPELDPTAVALLTQVLRLGLVLWDVSGDGRPEAEAWRTVIMRIADAVAPPTPPAQASS